MEAWDPGGSSLDEAGPVMPDTHDESAAHTVTKGVGDATSTRLIQEKGYARGLEAAVP